MTIKIILLIILAFALVAGMIVSYIYQIGGKVTVMPIPGLGIGFQKTEDLVDTDEYGQVLKSTLYLELIFIYIVFEWAHIVDEGDSEGDNPENIAYGN